jgi:hypothetical protein
MRGNSLWRAQVKLSTPNGSKQIVVVPHPMRWIRARLMTNSLAKLSARFTNLAVGVGICDECVSQRISSWSLHRIGFELHWLDSARLKLLCSRPC